MNFYSAPPFSGDLFSENEQRLKANESPCAICGKAVKYPFRHEAVVVNGGEWATTPEQLRNESDPGYMGVWGIGPDCHRKYLVKE